MRKTFTILLVVVIASTTFAQVPQKVVVEHFTNTRCSFCASRNPGFYTNINNFPEVIHLSIHPSSPYSNCLFNMHNVSENDGRTNYYGVYGDGTPRLVIQGNVISGGADYSDSTLFTDALGQTSPASIKITSNMIGNDSVAIMVNIKTEATHPQNTLSLFAAIAEDTIDYSAPNGEKFHYDVFRQSLFNVTGNSFVLPATIGDSILFTATVAINSEWNPDALEAIVMVQDSISKEVLQAEKYAIPMIADTSGGGTTTTFIQNKNSHSITIYPNPVKNVLHINMLDIVNATVNVYNILGEVVITPTTLETHLDVSGLKAGIYFVQIIDEQNKYFIEKFTKR